MEDRRYGTEREASSFFIGNKNFINDLKKTPKCIKYALTGGKGYKDKKDKTNTLNSIEKSNEIRKR